MSHYKILLWAVITIIFCFSCLTAILFLPVKLLVDIIVYTFVAIVSGLACEYIYNVVIKKGM